jgi:hypothetical protein
MALHRDRQASAEAFRFTASARNGVLNRRGSRTLLRGFRQARNNVRYGMRSSLLTDRVPAMRTTAPGRSPTFLPGDSPEIREEPIKNHLKNQLMVDIPYQF